MIQPNMTIEGLQEAQAAMNKVLAELQPRGAYGRAVQLVTIGAHSYLVSITHVDTGAYRAAQRAQVRLEQEPRGVVFVDPSARNPRTGERPADYALDEEARGGSHAAYRRTVSEAGPRLLSQADAILIGAMPRGR